MSRVSKLIEEIFSDDSSQFHPNRYENIPVKPGTELHAETASTLMSSNCSNPVSVGITSDDGTRPLSSKDIMNLNDRVRILADNQVAHDVVRILQNQSSPYQSSPASYGTQHVVDTTDKKILEILSDPNSESRRFVNELINTILDEHRKKKLEEYNKANTEVSLEDLI